MADNARERRAPPELAVAALVGAAAIPLSRLFSGDGLGGTVIVALAFSLSVSWLSRRMHLSPALGWVVSVVCMLWFISVRYFPDTLFAIFPSQGTFRELGSAIREGAQQIYDEAVPVSATSQLMIFVTGGVWLTVWLVDTSALALGNPMLGVVSTFPLFLLAGALQPSKRLWVDAGLFIAAAAWMLFDRERARTWRSDARGRAGWRAGTAARVALVGTVVAVLIGPLLPGFGATPWLKSRGPGARVGFNPFVAIKPTLDNKDDRLLFVVQTDQPTYYRLTSVEVFDGKVFRAGNRTYVNATAWTPLSGTGTTVLQRYTVHALGGDWLPASYRPTRIDGINGVRIEQQTDSLVIPRGTALPIQYGVVSDVPALTAAQLDRPVSYDPALFGATMQLPKVPNEVRDIANRVAGAEPTPFKKALALQRYLRGFTYDEDIAESHSFDDIVTFLTKVKAGYCEQFAASMAVLARALGMPSRVAIGFAPGSSAPNSPHVYNVSTRDAHAWPEIFFPDAGWVAFEPTPRAGVVRAPSYTVAQNEPTTDPTPTSSADPTASTSVRPFPTETTPASGDGSAGGGIPRWTVPLSVLLGLILVAAVALAVFAVRRRARIRHAHDTREIVSLRYVDLLEWCAAAGLPRAPGETPREFAHRTGAAVPPAAEPLGRLAVLVDEALFAPPNGLDPEDAALAVADARAAISQTLKRPKRLLTALGWGRWRGR